MRINFDKIKKIPWFIAQKDFWSTIFLVALAILIGVFVWYKYVYLVDRVEFQTSSLANINEEKYEKVLDQLNKREERFGKVPFQENLFKLEVD